VVWKWLHAGNRWASTTLFLGNLITYLSPVSLDLTVRSIEGYEWMESLLYGIIVATRLLVRQMYFNPFETDRLHRTVG
jgi:hypothetical protein